MAEAMGDRVYVAGDLVRDSLTLGGPDSSGEDAAPSVLFFPGSRASIREFSFPFLKWMLPCLKDRAPGWRFRIVLSPFSTPGEEETWRSAGFFPARGAEAFRGAEFAVTQPGTNTLELMYRRIPFCVLVPFASLRKVPLPGIPGLIASLPGIGPRLRETVLRRRRKKMELLAWPNRLAGRMLAEEYIGDYSPETAAEFVVSWLHDRSRRDGLRDALGDVAESAPQGAAVRIADEIERMTVPV
jgi:lipid-A-disaccharide synthase